MKKAIIFSFKIDFKKILSENKNNQKITKMKSTLVLNKLVVLGFATKEISISAHVNN